MLGLELYLNGLLAHRRLVGKAHAIGRKNAGQRMNEHPRHTQRIGDKAGVLAAGAAKAAQRVFSDIVTALHRNLLDGVGHVANGDVDEALGHGLGCARIPRGLADVPGKSGEFLTRDIGIQTLGAGTPEHRRKKLRLYLAQHDIAIGHGQRTILSIRGRPRVRPGRVGTDAVTRAIKMENGTAARCHGVDAHHRRTHAHTGNLGLKHPLEVGQLRSGEMRHIGGGAAHVETDDFFEARHERGAHRANDAPSRPGQNGVLALEAPRIGKAAVRLHEHQTHTGQFGGDLIHIAAQDGRQIRVNHRGVTARHQLHQGADLVRGRYLTEADRPRRIGDGFFIFEKPIAMHEHDGNRAVTLGVGHAELTLRRSKIKRHQHLAARARALIHLRHFRVQQFGQHDIAVKQARTVLVGDAQGITKAARDQQQCFFTLAFEQRVGGHGGAHLDRFDLLAWNSRAGGHSHQVTYARHRRVTIMTGVFRQQLVCADGAIWAARDDICEGAATIYPELPAQ